MAQSQADILTSSLKSQRFDVSNGPPVRRRENAGRLGVMSFVRLPEHHRLPMFSYRLDTEYVDGYGSDHKSRASPVPARLWRDRPAK